MSNNNHFEHHLLIAMPNLTDDTFSRAVIYLFEHSEEGALGMVINKPLQIKLGNVLNHLGIEKVDAQIAEHTVINGGPVGQEHGFILYTLPDEPEVLVSTSRELLEDIGENKGPEQFIVTLGYAGWGPKQLDEEITRNDWLVAPADKIIVFGTPIYDQWRKAAESIGVDLEKLSGQSGHA